MNIWRIFLYYCLWQYSPFTSNSNHENFRVTTCHRRVYGMFRRKNMNCHGVPSSIECGVKSTINHNLSRIESVADFIFFSEEDTVCHAGFKNPRPRKFSDLSSNVEVLRFQRSFAISPKEIPHTL